MIKTSLSLITIIFACVMTTILSTSKASVEELEGNYNGQTLNRTFLLELEHSILNCRGDGSFCDEYRCWINPLDENKDYFNCHHFAYIALYHTTTNFDHCNEGKIFDVMTTATIKLKAETTDIYAFVWAIATFQNKMCYVGVNDVHFLAIEIRANGFYIYNSWLNLFSNAWFSGLKEGHTFFENMSLEVKKITMEYRSKCGVGKLLTTSGLHNCFKILEKITYQAGSPVKTMIIDTLICRDLNKKFKALE